MGSGGEIASLIVMVIGTVLTLVCVAIPFWKKNDPEDTIRDSIVRHEGLWIKCQTFQTGNWDCDDFNRFFLGLPTQLQVARGFSITSMVLAVFSIGAMCVGMDSIPCGTDSKGTKKRIRLIAGAMGFLSGLLILASVSWYGNDVRIQHEIATQQLFVSQITQTRYIFGEALFLGWAGGACLILAGILALCTGCGGGDSYEDAHPRYAYRPPTKNAGNSQEYV
ncbi:claudin-7-like [Clavelina lepadiformis]|uniref:Claudin n=1 Tax=Clavelina lepadiformis TaxID=159417 RepID=A0ABP0FJI0_CLALP